MKISTKKLYALNYIEIAICVIGTAILLVFTPNTIPAHYNFSGEVDRFGSKYENLLFPVLAILMGIFFLLYAKKQGKIQGSANEKMVLYASSAVLLFLNVVSFYYMIKAIQYDSADIANVDTMKFGSIVIGILLVVLGNIMPKVRRNSIFGLRTKWSMANDSVWQKSQRFSGIVLVFCGFILIITAAVIPGKWNIASMAVILIASGIISVIASYKYYVAEVSKNYKNGNY